TSKPVLSSKTISPLWPIEEERNPHYNPRKYYPARIGEYVTLKITNSGAEEKKAAEDELQISQHIAGLRSEHEGRAYPLREPIWLLGRHLGSKGVPPQVLKAFLRVILCGLDFLHSECHVMHTDLKADNFLIGFEDTTVLDQYVRQQELHPAPHVLRNGRPVFESRNDFGPLKRGVGLLRISDFSAAVFGDVSTPHNHDIQPQPFCAPEVLLKAGWSYSADIWNLGTVYATNAEGYSREVHIAQIIRLLGPPPSQFMNKCDPHIRNDLFSPQGTFKFPELIPSEESNFSNMTPFLQGEDQRLFIDFVRKMLQWEPERRSSAKEIYNDPWLYYNP
ncbi:hypothetical protein ASPNIDRAFT_124073, partial [Aspergillus niger ATCC 1015]